MGIPGNQDAASEPPDIRFPVDICKIFGIFSWNRGQINSGRIYGQFDIRSIPTKGAHGTD